MQSKHFRPAPGLAPRIPPLFRFVSALVGFALLATPAAQAADNFPSLVQHNRVSAPYPSSYSKEYLAKLKPKAVKPAAVLVAKAKAPKTKTSRTSALELAATAKKNPAVHQQLARVAPKPENSPLVDAVIGPSTSNSSRPNVKVGYGRMVTDSSNTVGHKNGTRLEEPAVLYVKATVNF